MRIAQISPLYESVPPALYGGTERVVSYLTEELVKAGHDVTLFASGDSITAARLVPMCEKAIRLDERRLDPVTLHLLAMEQALRMQGSFDIIHSHVDSIGFVLARRARVPVVSTLHGRLDLFEHCLLFGEYCELPFVSISEAQRLPAPQVNWVATVHHGLPKNCYSLGRNVKDYLVYIGRISPEKRVDSAIAIAKACGIPIKIAAKVDRADEQYFRDEIERLLEDPLVEFLGEVDNERKNELLGSAIAFLHAVDWPEPFGLSMIEAMACGTPVIARRRGSIPEVVDHGVTGFIFEEEAEAVRHIKDLLPFFSRERCRKRFEERFLSERMALDYVKVYEGVIGASKEAEVG